MIGPTASQLVNLLTATESIRYNHHVFRRLSDCRKEYPFADADRDAIVVLVIAKRAGHPAAPSVQDSSVQSRRAQRGRRRFCAVNRLLVTVHMRQCITDHGLKIPTFEVWTDKAVEEHSALGQYARDRSIA